MPTVYTLAANEISVSNGKTVSVVSGGNGSHLNGETITLDSNNWQAIEVTDSNANFQDNQAGSQSLTSAINFNGTSYGAGRWVEAEYTVVFADPDGNEYTLVAFNIREVGESNAFCSVEGLAFVGGFGGFPPVGVPLTFVSNQEGPSVPYADLATPPCFTSGSVVSTPDGPRVIDDLDVGDLVNTLDHGPQPNRWIAQTRLPRAALQMDRELCPIRVQAGAFGLSCPERDTLVSPQHHILVSGHQAALYYGEDEVLVPAKKLVNDHSIRVQDEIEDVEYFHLVFDTHEVLCVDSLLSESYFLNETSDTVLPIKNELLAVFGVHSIDEIQVPAARVCVDNRFTALLVA